MFSTVQYKAILDISYDMLEPHRIILSFQNFGYMMDSCLINNIFTEIFHSFHFIGVDFDSVKNVDISVAKKS